MTTTAEQRPNKNAMSTTGRRFPLRRISGALLLAAASFTAPALLAASPAAPPAADAAPAAEPEETAIDFQRDIRPLLAEHCFECHGPDQTQRQADLRLDLRHTAVADPATADSGQAAAIVPGQPEQSELYRRIATPDASLRMPPPESGKTLLPVEVERLRQWIAQGAPWEEHWAFVAPSRPAVPNVSDASWPRSPIDRFVLAKLKQSDLRPAPEADRAALIRRVTLDLTGLPPTLAEVDAFLADSSPEAYERVVDRLLASPAYGERMALEWLDAARFADSGGYQGDILRSMWPWRDWVINAFNRNQPFDQFTVEQLAGDLLPESPQQQQPTEQQKIATGFNRNHRINDEDGIIHEEFRVEYVVDRVETTATVWLGLTLGCARCHSHKYDPVSQTEFYQFFAFFNNIAEEGRGHGNSPPLLSLSATDHGATSVMVMEELEQPRTTHVLIRGAYDQPGEAVSAGVPAVLPALPPDAPRNRLGLAHWLVDPENPLTARVTVNRLWQMLFGTGIVATPEDFGIRGEPPSHPELLDFLALEFIDSGWDVKALLRRIVTTATYRQSTQGSPESWQRDPGNRLLARGPRFRLAAELIRDQALAASGFLVREQGGPSVRPYQPAGLWEELASAHREYEQSSGAGLYRRSLYTFWRRTIPPPSLVAFDAPNRELCAVRRPRTNTPLQALVLMNDPTYVEASRALAARVIRQGEGGPAARITAAFQLLLARRPTPTELKILAETFNFYAARYHRDPEAAREFLAIADASESAQRPTADEAPLPTTDEGQLPTAEWAALAAVAATIMNLDEAITKE